MNITSLRGGPIRITFEKVTVRGQRRGECAVCGKTRTRSRTFWQTISPFNKKRGKQKTREQITAELDKELAKWLREPFICASCEENLCS
jgi:hypothetical protein